MTAGAIQTTGNPLDVAIQGDGFFRVVDDPTTPRRHPTYMYTRAGNFTTDANGDLVTHDGLLRRRLQARLDGNPLTGAANETKITIPPGSQSVTIGQNGTVSVDRLRRRRHQGRRHLAGASSRTTPASSASAATTSVASNNSGAETANIAGTNGLGTLTPGAIEMSNVDLAQEFTNMITAQRGFQANSRVISTADEMLQELVNLKH